MNKADKEGAAEYVLLGKVSKPHGIRGELKIFPYSGDPEQFARTYRRVFLQCHADLPPVEYRVEQSRVQGRQVLVGIEGCTDRNTAEKLKGCKVYGAADDLPELEEGEFFLHDLIDRELVDESGQIVGRCTGLLDTGGPELLVVERDGRDVLIPVVGAFIRSIEADRIIVHLPPGLLEIND